MNQEENKDEPDFNKCAKCDHIPCINLFRRTGRLEGEELFIFDQLIQSKKFIPCIAGAPIYALCQCTSAMMEAKETKSLPITHVLLQVIKDLKCSSFLALCGHYRNAIQVLRPVIENFLAGCYFSLLGKVEDYEQWLNKKYEIPPSLWNEVKKQEVKRKQELDYAFCLEFMTEKIPPEYKKWWGKKRDMVEKEIIRVLNRYLHPHFPSFEIASTAKCSSCPASVKYNKKEQEKWLGLYQRILYFIFENLIINFREIIFPKAKNALRFLKQPPEMEEEFIAYDQYREFVEWLEKHLTLVESF